MNERRNMGLLYTILDTMRNQICAHTTDSLTWIINSVPLKPIAITQESHFQQYKMQKPVRNRTLVQLPKPAAENIIPTTRINQKTFNCFYDLHQNLRFLTHFCLILFILF